MKYLVEIYIDIMVCFVHSVHQGPCVCVCVDPQTPVLVFSVYRRQESSHIQEAEAFSSKRCLEWFYEYAGKCFTKYDGTFLFLDD